MRIRVIDYTTDDGRDNDETYRLFTTILDPDDVTATDLAATYAQRWEIEPTSTPTKRRWWLAMSWFGTTVFPYQASAVSHPDRPLRPATFG